MKACWICGENAETGEHRNKKTDIELVFGIKGSEHLKYQYLSLLVQWSLDSGLRRNDA